MHRQWDMKINLLVSETDLNSFCADWMQPILQEYFNVIYFEHDHSYSKFDTVVVTKSYNKNWHKKLDGYKIALDNLWDRPNQITDNTCYTPNWFWYNESLWYRHLGYHNYMPQKNYTKLAFMPINYRSRHTLMAHRTQIVNALGSLKNDFIYSFVDSALPDDIEPTNPNWQRYFNPKWYDDTCFSLVVETGITGPTTVTEKTFKPIAFSNPMLVWGTVGILQKIKDLGFETFDNLFDESYDVENNNTRRLETIISNVKEFIKEPYDAITLEKLEHNRYRFFDYNLVKSKIIEEVVNPLLEYANQH